MTETTARPTGEQSISPAIGWGVSLLFVGLILAAATWCSFWADNRNDQYQLLNLGRAVYEGQRLYLDAWENKPPGIAWLNALGYALGGGHAVGAWVLPGALALLAIGLMGWVMGRLLSPLAGWGGMMLAAVVIAQRVYDSPSINPDFHSAMFELMAGSIWLLALYTHRGGLQTTFAVSAGLCWAAAITVKQTGFVGLAAMTLLAVVLCIGKGGDARAWLRTTGWAWAGCAGGLILVVSILWFQSILGPAWQATFTFNREMLAEGQAGAGWRSWVRAREGLAPVMLPLWLGLLGLMGTVLSTRSRKSSPAIMYAWLLWWVGQVVLALMGPSRSMRYWLATFPAMFWLSGLGLYHLGESLRRIPKGYRQAIALTVITLFVVLGRPLYDHFVRGVAGSWLAYGDPDNDRARLNRLGAALRPVVPTGEAIYVWHYDVGVYLTADRRPASRYTYPRSAAQMTTILDDLAAGRAHTLLLPQRPSPVFGGWCQADCESRLAELRADYTQGGTIDGYVVWTKKASQTETERG